MSVEDYSLEIINALNNLQQPDRKSKNHNLGSFYEISDSPLISPERDKIKKQNFLNDLSDYQDSNGDSPLLSDCQSDK